MFYFFWIPERYNNLQNKFPKIIKSEINDIIISDNNDEYILNLKLEKSNNLNITLLDKSKNITTYFCLKYIKFILGNFLIYELTKSEENKIDKKILNGSLHNYGVIELQIYHFFKSFFHIHEFHNEDEDTILLAYKTIELNGANKIAIKHYLNYYIERFNLYFKSIELELSEFEDMYQYLREISFFSKDTFLLDEFKNLEEVLNRINKRIDRIKNELQYVNKLSSYIINKKNNQLIIRIENVKIKNQQYSKKINDRKEYIKKIGIKIKKQIKYKKIMPIVLFIITILIIPILIAVYQSELIDIFKKYNLKK